MGNSQSSSSSSIVYAKDFEIKILLMLLNKTHNYLNYLAITLQILKQPVVQAKN